MGTGQVGLGSREPWIGLWVGTERGEWNFLTRLPCHSRLSLPPCSVMQWCNPTSDNDRRTSNYRQSRRDEVFDRRVDAAIRQLDARCGSSLHTISCVFVLRFMMQDSHNYRQYFPIFCEVQGNFQLYLSLIFKKTSPNLPCNVWLKVFQFGFTTCLTS
jgi:hypothetical protein